MVKRNCTSTSERSGRRWLGCRGLALLAVLVGWAPSALATPEYPGVLDDVVQTRCTDPLSRCLVCHTTALGGRTATQPFALSLRQYGLNRGHDPGALRNALLQLPEDTDSDVDGIPDKQELVGCLNPSGEEFGIPPAYGCDGGTLGRPKSSRYSSANDLSASMSALMPS